MSQPLLKAVHVATSNDGDEYYEEDRAGVTAVEWYWQPGHMTMIPTIRVFKDGKLFSEHPFHSVLGVYYKEIAP